MKETYSIVVGCTNCDWEGKLTLPKGQQYVTAKCQKCGCMTLVKRSNSLDKYLLRKIDDDRYLCSVKVDGFEGSPTLPLAIGDRGLV